MHRIVTAMLATSILVLSAISNVHAENSSEKPCPCQKKEITTSRHGRQAVTISASRPGHHVAGHPITTAHSRAGHRPHPQSVDKNA